MAHSAEEFRQRVAQFKKTLLEGLRQGIAEGMDLIGITAQGEYWIAPGGPAIPVNPTKLTARSGRLIRSLSPQGGAFHSGQREQVRKIEVKDGKIVGFFGSSVPYAAIHEFGGTIHHTNLFGRGIEATIHMPERPYLHPAFENAKPKIVKIMHDKIEEAIGTIVE